MIDLLEKAARAGGKVLLKYFKKEFTTSYKSSHKDIVTSADIASQKVIYKTLISELSKKGIPKSDIGIIAEENLKVSGKHLFIVDPLDGTTNFSIGLTNFCIPIAYFYAGKVRDALVYFPYEDIIYMAQMGKGAYKIDTSGKKALKIKYKPLKQGVISSHLSSNVAATRRLLPALMNLYPEVCAIRLLGVAAYEHCLVTENVLVASILPNCYIWDFAATKLILEEAGANLVNFEGNPLYYDLKRPEKAYQVITAHPKNIPEILKAFE